MAHFRTLKDHSRENKSYNRRALAAVIIVCLFLLIVIGRLLFLQVFQYDLYKTLSLHNQVRIVPIVPNRGLIFDRNGVVLAENVPAFSLEITKERVANMAETLRVIDSIIPLTETERNRFYTQLKYKRPSEGVPLRIKLSEAEVAKFSVQKHRLPGVDIKARLIRSYPGAEIFAHALGYVGPISEKEIPDFDPVNYRGTYYTGKTGVEKYHEKILHGTVGYQHVETDAKGQTIRILKQILPIPGAHLHLSLDSDLQRVAYQAMQDLTGAVVAIEPDSGAVLALVSTPSFDPNIFSQGIDSKTYQELQQSDTKPLFNRALQAQYPPGSTIKPLVALKGLELGVISPEFSLFDPGWYQLNGAGRRYRDWIYLSKNHGHGQVNLEKAITQSCDTYFFTLAHKLGISALHQIYTAFGLGKRTGIDSAGEVSGLAPSAEWKQRTLKQAWYPGDTLNVGIGQGSMLATPLQLAQLSAIIANRGSAYAPRLVQALEEESKKTLEYPEKELLHFHTSTDQNWQHIIDAMQKVVHDRSGTAHRINPGTAYTVAAKTGTAQVFNLKQHEKYVVSKVKVHLRDHSWFIAFAPVQKPRIALAVLVENKYKKAGLDIAKEVLEAFFNTEVPSLKQNPSSSNVLDVTASEAADDEDKVGGEEDAP